MHLVRPKRNGWVNRSLKLATVAVGISAASGPAAAFDWEFLYRLSDTVRASDNIVLEPDPDGYAASNNSSAGLDLTMRTPTLTWGFSGDIGYLVYFGDGAPDTRSVVSRAIKSDLLQKTRDTDYSASAFYSLSPASTTQFTELGIIELDVERLSYGASGGVLHRINARDSLDFSTRATWTDFSTSDPDLVPNEFLETSLRWTRKFNRRIDGNLYSSVGWYQADNETETENLIYKVTVGTDAKLTRRLDIVANAGLAIVDQYALDPSQPALGRMRNIAIGFIGDFSMNWRPERDTTFTASLSQSVSPDDLGDLRNSQSVRGALVHQINDLSSFAINSVYTISTSSDEETDSRETLSVSPSYSRRITPHWNAVIGYQWIQANDGIDITDANFFFLTLSHTGEFLP